MNKNMENKLKRFDFALWILLGLLFLVIGQLLASLYFLNKEEDTPSCEIVDGDTHVYRGQCLPDGYRPEVLPLKPRANWLNTTQYLDIRAKVLVEQLIDDAEKDGMCLVVTSGYRSYEEQSKIYNNSPEDRRIYIATPGSSEHQTGLAVDFAACPMSNGIRDDAVERLELAEDFEDLPEYGWLTSNANKYGLQQSFTVENIEETGYAVESWHWKVVIN